MTVVVEGKMCVQFYRRERRSLIPDGQVVVLGKGDVGYISAGRIHDARYVDACRLVYVHDGAFRVPACRGRGRAEQSSHPVGRQRAATAGPSPRARGRVCSRQANPASRSSSSGSPSL